MNAKPCIELHQVQCHIQQRLVVDIQSLRVHAGERIALIGPNGAGKSTLLKLLTGFIAPSAGQVMVLNTPLNGRLKAQALRSLRQQVGHLLQNTHLVGRLSVLDNTLVGALGRTSSWGTWLRRFPAAEHHKAHALLAQVGMAHRLHDRADALSGGQRQKVALARLLLQNPRIILADEPTAALDPQAAQSACEHLTHISPSTTLIAVVHSPALLPLLAHRVIAMEQGRIAWDLPLAQVQPDRLGQLYAAPTSAHGKEDHSNDNHA